MSLASVLGAPVHTNLVGRAHDTVAELQQNGAATLALAVLAVLVGGVAMFLGASMWRSWSGERRATGSALVGLQCAGLAAALIALATRSE